uniref:Uncharacterized protein n=1 Tax=Plectus sambesii TaxID=2011161 RepID=A0A914X810_9BILA
MGCDRFCLRQWTTAADRAGKCRRRGYYASNRADKATSVNRLFPSRTSRRLEHLERRRPVATASLRLVAYQQSSIKLCRLARMRKLRLKLCITTVPVSVQQTLIVLRSIADEAQQQLAAAAVEEAAADGSTMAPRPDDDLFIEPADDYDVVYGDFNST